MPYAARGGLGHELEKINDDFQHFTIMSTLRFRQLWRWALAMGACSTLFQGALLPLWLQSGCSKGCARVLYSMRLPIPRLVGI